MICPGIFCSYLSERLKCSDAMLTCHRFFCLSFIETLMQENVCVCITLSCWRVYEDYNREARPISGYCLCFCNESIYHVSDNSSQNRLMEILKPL